MTSAIANKIIAPAFASSTFTASFTATFYKSLSISYSGCGNKGVATKRKTGNWGVLKIVNAER